MSYTVKELLNEMNFDEANETKHPVEKQWHYPILTKHGYEPEIKTATGFVRHYSYIHPKTGHKMNVTTGVTSDYWDDDETGAHGYHGSLDAHLSKK